MNLKTIIAAAVIAAVPALSYAQAKDPAATPGIDKRQEIQQKTHRPGRAVRRTEQA